MSQYPLTEDQVRDRFAYHPATSETALLHDAVRTACTELAVVLNERLPAARETSLALTALQETMMWANASIAINGAPQATEEQRRTPQPSHGQGEPVAIRERLFTCPNCQEQVPANKTGHINPHWQNNGYEKDGFSCIPKEPEQQ